MLENYDNREPVGEISRSEEALSWQFEDADAPTG